MMLLGLNKYRAYIRFKYAYLLPLILVFKIYIFFHGFALIVNGGIMIN